MIKLSRLCEISYGSQESLLWIEVAENLKDDQLEHDARERERDRERKYDHLLMHFVVLEQLFHKEDPAADKKHKL